jgi:hypothetical protein
MEQLELSADNGDYTPNEEDNLRRAMVAQWKADKAKVKARGIVPDWMGEPRPLSRDRAAVLELLYDVGCIEWNGNPSRNNQIIAGQIGRPVAHIKGLLDAMLAEGLLTSRLWDDKPIWEMTHAGEYALEEWQIDRELGIL